MLAFIALGCLLWKGHEGMKKGGKIAIISLALVWVGYGVIDILFKQIAKSGSAFPVTLLIAFIGAGIFMLNKPVNPPAIAEPTTLAGIIVFGSAAA